MLGAGHTRSVRRRGATGSRGNGLLWRGLFFSLAAIVIPANAAANDGAESSRASVPGGARSASVFGRFTKHVVVIYQENHSFDETLGRFCQDHHGRCDGY